MRWIEQLLRVERSSPALMRAQAAAYAKQVPVLYVILVSSSWALAWTFHGSAPFWLNATVPAAMAVTGCVRSWMWWRARGRPIETAEAAALLRQSMLVMLPMGVIFSAWCLALFPYGDAWAQAHVAFFMGITVIGCIFSLMHMRNGALLITGIVVPTMTGFFMLSGNPVLMAISVNMLLVTGAMIVVLLVYSRDFAALVRSRQDLLDRHADLERLSDENHRLANVDALTGLPNRRRFFAELDRRIERARMGGGRLVLALIDLDGFKPINDVYGHATGDAVLAEAAQRLRSLPGPARFVARLGGDEFALALDADLDEAALRDLGRSICAALEQPYRVVGVTAQLAGSVGIAVFPDTARSREQLLEHADYALYHAKNRLRGTAILFSAEHEREVDELGRIDHKLRHADLEQELWVVVQPIVDTSAGRTVGLEALARWTSPEIGFVPPAVFIRSAERSGLIAQVTLVLLRKALASAGSWPARVRIAFNLSARDICSREQVQRIVETIAASGVDPARIDLEITETALMHDFAQARAALQRFKALGVGIALDDFGTGHSSLSYVHRLPLDKIKIDRSFITDIERDATSRSIVQTILALCRNLDLACVVEGIETDGQRRQLEALGCRLMQGYLLGRPMPAEDVVARLDAERSEPPSPVHTALPDRRRRSAELAPADHERA